jgi:cullin-4
LAEKPKLPADFEEKTWSKLKEAVKAVHEKRRIEYSLEELYRVSFSFRSSG